MNKLRKLRYKFSVSIGILVNFILCFMIWLKLYKIYSEKIIVLFVEIIVDSIEFNGKKIFIKLNIMRIIIVVNKVLFKKDKFFFIFVLIKVSVVKVMVVVINVIRMVVFCFVLK